MKKRVALVLGSGGARGYAHIGVIEEIERRGYDIACIAGCSMGAVVGGIYAAGKLDEYRNWIESLDYLDVLRLVDEAFAWVRFVAKKSSARSARLSARSISKNCAFPTPP